jgi:hypothetical protein
MPGPTYDLLGYRRLIVDYHFSDFVPGTLANADAGDTVAACAALGVDSVLVYAKDHWGHCYYATVDPAARHPNVPQDLFGQVLDGLRRRGIVGAAYFSVGWDEHAVRSHPGWAMRDARGAPIRRGAPDADRVTGRWTYLCINSPYRDAALGQIRELVARYDFPALFLDILFLNPARQVCHCDHCRALWAREHADPLPATFTPEALRFAVECLGRFHRDVKAVIAASGKAIRTTHNFGLPYLDDDYVAFEVNPLGRNYLRDSALAKIMRAEAAGREVELIGHRFNQDWDFTTKSGSLMRWEAATVLAHNCALMWVDQPNMDGSFDPQAAAAMRAAYAVVDDLAPHVSGSTPYAEIALLYASDSVALDPHEELDFVGAYRLLTELHWPFDVIAARSLTVEELRRFRLLLIPNSRHLAPPAGAAVAAYVAGGGALLFTHETATADLAGRPLPQPGFGLVRIAGPLPHAASFLKPVSAVPLGSTHLRVTETLAFQPAHGAEVRATHVAPNIDVTREQWVSHNVAPGQDTGRPAVVSGALGRGRYVYCAPRLFAETVRQGLPALRDFLEGLLRHLVRPSIRVEAPRIVETTFSRQEDDLVVCLVNGVVGKPALGGVMLLRETPGALAFDEFLPIRDVRIHVRGQPVAVACDRRGRPLAITETADGPVVTLERLEEYEVVRIAGYFTASQPPL